MIPTDQMLGLMGLLLIVSLAGCDGQGRADAVDPEVRPQETAPVDPVGVMGDGPWQVIRLGATELVPGSSITIERFEPGRIAGLASCNRYNATVIHDDDGQTRILRPASTLMACPDEALAQQEFRFLEALIEIVSIDLNEQGQLVLRPADGEPIIARRYLND